uniref:HMA domain-containing protein n=1 Tax=Fagus sylvatica TaxID=28930 RepID=A0A2N9GR57_FAGSY
MVLKVDLQCHRCFKKVYNEKENLVVIKVVCCSPEKIKEKLIYKGGGVIKSIEIKAPEKPKPADKPKDEKPKDEKPKDEKPKEKPKDEKPKDDKPKDEKPKDEKPKEKAADPAPKAQALVVQPVPAHPYGVVVCCGSCSQGGPCQFGHGYGIPPQYYEYGRPVYDSYGGGYRNGYQVSRSDNYFSDENPTACTVM